MKGQGATEYLVLLAVVLIIALVGIALLGFFPGTANDAQLAENRIYWQSATPVAITESDAKYLNSFISTPYLRIRNAGNYQIRLTKIIGPANTISYICGSRLISDYYLLSPGEETFFGYNLSYPALPFDRDFDLRSDTNASNCGIYLAALCPASGPGLVQVNPFGFEYIAYVEGQQIVKRQVGAKPLMIKCG